MLDSLGVVISEQLSEGMTYLSAWVADLMVEIPMSLGLSGQGDREDAGG